MSMDMTPNNAKNEYKKYKNRVNFEDEVAELLAEKGRIRRAQLVNDLLEGHKGERGYSLKSINRKLDQMIKTEFLISLKFKDLQKYGIEETDRRASYLILKKSLKMKEDLDKIFSYLDSGEPDVQKQVLEELARYKEKYVLDPHQLDVLAVHLDSKDDELVNDLLDILFKYITEKGIEPSNKEKILENLRALLKRHKKSPIENPNLRRRVTGLLGYYRDSFVIEQLKEDAETLEDPTSVSSDYYSEFIAPLIEEHSLELFNFQMDLKLRGKGKASELISRIKDNVCTPKNPLEAIEGSNELEKSFGGIKRRGQK